MIAEVEDSIIEHIRSIKEENAAQHGYSVRAIIEAARERQNSSGREVIRQTKAEQADAGSPAKPGA